VYVSSNKYIKNHKRQWVTYLLLPMKISCTRIDNIAHECLSNETRYTRKDNITHKCLSNETLINQDRQYNTWVFIQWNPHWPGKTIQCMSAYPMKHRYTMKDNWWRDFFIQWYPIDQQRQIMTWFCYPMIPDRPAKTNYDMIFLSNDTR